MRFFISVLLIGLVSPILLQAQPSGSWMRLAGLRADHRSVEAFDQLSDSSRVRASRLRLMFRHASVGTTIDNALDCLQGTRTNPTECRSYSPYHFDRRLWQCQARGNSGWYDKADDFVREATAHAEDFDVLCFKYCYIDGLDGLDVPCGSTNATAKIQQAFSHYREAMELMESRYPTKVMVWWTIPLTQVGQDCTDSLNARIRAYAMQQGKVLFDIADIQSHDPAGLPIVSPRGTEAAYKPHCGEQQPDAQACHPNWTGSIRIAKALWWLMSRIAESTTTNTIALSSTSSMTVSLSPNPARENGQALVTLSSPASVTIRMMDCLGRVVGSESHYRLSTGSHVLPLPIRDLASGLYQCVVLGADRPLLRSLRIVR